MNGYQLLIMAIAEFESARGMKNRIRNSVI
jgi:hypothetical protein